MSTIAAKKIVVKDAYALPEVPGSLGQVLTAGVAGLTEWAAANGGFELPEGGLLEQVLASDGAGGATWSSIDGLTYFAEATGSLVTGTVPANQFYPIGLPSKIHLALTPKGGGALIIQPVGNARGLYAVDLQPYIGTDTCVASGEYSVLIGGLGNTASGANSGIFAGGDNLVSGYSAAILGGLFHHVSSEGGSAVGGRNHRVDGKYSVGLGGRDTQALTRRATVTSGAEGGKAQGGYQMLYKQTPDATPAVLSTAGMGVYSDQHGCTALMLADNSAVGVTASVVGRDTATGKCRRWVIYGLLKRGVGAGTVEIVGSQIDFGFAETGTEAWAAALSVNTSEGAATVTVTGEAATTIKWTCKLEFEEAIA